VQYSHNIVDVAFQHHVAVSSRHDVVWGGGARQASTRFIPGYALAVYPERKTDRLYSAFVQDEIKMTNTAWLTVGSKFEHNDYTGFEFEPSAQVLWTPAEEHTVWFSAARAIRQPSRIDAGIQYDTAVVPGSPLLVTTTTGNPNLKAERLYDLEAGYRGKLSRQFSLDLAIFGGWYRDLVAPVPQAPVFTTYPAPPHLFLSVQFQNAASAHTYGAELFLNANVTRRWRVSPGYSRIRLTIEPNAGVTSNGQSLLRPNTPENQFQFRSFLNLPHNLEWDQTLGYVGAITHQSVPSYVRLDTRFGWRMGESWEFSVAGQNLLRPRHVEVPDEYGLNRVEIQRSVFAKVCWRF
jgi:iron complex outermembrane recepter protein